MQTFTSATFLWGSWVQLHLVSCLPSQSPSDSARSPWIWTAVAVLALVLLALNLRTAVTNASSIFDLISADLPLEGATTGVLTMLPPVTFAIAGLITPWLLRRVRLELLIVVALAAIIAGHLLRGAAPNIPTLLGGSVVALLGMGIGNILLPPVVVTYFRSRIPLMTSTYAIIVALGTMLPPLVAAPVALASGWRTSLSMWAVVAASAAVPWLVLLVRAQVRAARGHVAPSTGAITLPDGTRAKPAKSIWRSKRAWALAATFAISSMNAYCCFGWLPTILQDRAGADTVAAAGYLSLFAAMGIPLSLATPLVITHLGTTWPLISAATGFAVGYAGLIFAPTGAPVLWVVLIGFGQLIFPICLTLIGLRAAGQRGSAILSGFVQLVGYALAALAPLTVSVLATATGDWSISLGLLAVLTLAVIPLAPALAGKWKIEDEIQLAR